jgi:SAM-dependent methyltransferase/uncharacterized protein YbaR (Trm112 family)
MNVEEAACGTTDGYTWKQLNAILQCPICHSKLEFLNIDQGLPDSREFGVLNCGCSSYPVVDGIPIFIRGTVGALEHTTGMVEYQGPPCSYITSLVLSGKGLEALLRCIAFPLNLRTIERIGPRRLWRSRKFQEFTASLRRWTLRKWCIANHDTLTTEDWFDVFFHQYSPISGDLFNYFFHRFTQPRQLAALVLLNSLCVREKPILDLACGFGHLEHNLTESRNTRPVVGVDRNFFQLWTAQYWIAPKSRFVCADADQQLPFVDDSFSALFCSDAFHYFRDKPLALGEIVRCAHDQPVLLTRVGNKMVEPNEGLELTPREYLSILAERPGWRMFGEHELLDQYLRREPLDLTTPQAISMLDEEKWISFVHPGSPPRMSALPDSDSWPHSVGRLGINPIYKITRTADGNWRLQFKFPSDEYVFENFLMASYHPQCVTVTDQTLRKIQANLRSPDVERLIENMVVIGMPDHYTHESA